MITLRIHAHDGADHGTISLGPDNDILMHPKNKRGENALRGLVRSKPAEQSGAAWLHYLTHVLPGRAAFERDDWTADPHGHQRLQLTQYGDPIAMLTLVGNKIQIVPTGEWDEYRVRQALDRIRSPHWSDQDLFHALPEFYAGERFLATPVQEQQQQPAPQQYAFPRSFPTGLVDNPQGSKPGETAGGFSTIPPHPLSGPLIRSSTGPINMPPRPAGMDNNVTGSKMPPGFLHNRALTAGVRAMVRGHEQEGTVHAKEYAGQFHRFDQPHPLGHLPVFEHAAYHALPDGSVHVRPVFAPRNITHNDLYGQQFPLETNEGVLFGGEPTTKVQLHDDPLFKQLLAATAGTWAPPNADFNKAPYQMLSDWLEEREHPAAQKVARARNFHDVVSALSDHDAPEAVPQQYAANTAGGLGAEMRVQAGGHPGGFNAARGVQPGPVHGNLIRVVGGTGRTNFPANPPAHPRNNQLAFLSPPEITAGAMSAALQAQHGYQESEMSRRSGRPRTAVWGAHAWHPDEPMTGTPHHVGFIADHRGNVWSREGYSHSGVRSPSGSSPEAVGNHHWNRDYLSNRTGLFPAEDPHFRFETHPELRAFFDEMVQGNPRGGKHWEPHFHAIRGQLADWLNEREHPAADDVAKARFPDEAMSAIAKHEADAYHTANPQVFFGREGEPERYAGWVEPPQPWEGVARTAAPATPKITGLPSPAELSQARMVHRPSGLGGSALTSTLHLPDGRRFFAKRTVEPHQDVPHSPQMHEHQMERLANHILKTIGVPGIADHMTEMRDKHGLWLVQEMLGGKSSQGYAREVAGIPETAPFPLRHMHTPEHQEKMRELIRSVPPRELGALAFGEQLIRAADRHGSNFHFSPGKIRPLDYAHSVWPTRHTIGNWESTFAPKRLGQFTNEEFGNLPIPREIVEKTVQNGDAFLNALRDQAETAHHRPQTGKYSARAMLNHYRNEFQLLANLLRQHPAGDLTLADVGFEHGILHSPVPWGKG